jgi:hypothetical protein
MSFINLSSVYTADPGNFLIPKNSFMITDPFAVVMQIQADSSIVNNGLLFDASAQIVNPRQDPTLDGWWTIAGNSVFSMPTVDLAWESIDFKWGTNFAIWWWWNQYADAVSQVHGPTIEGVYCVQGTVNVEGTDLFSNSGQFWFKTR